MVSVKRKMILAPRVKGSAGTSLQELSSMMDDLKGDHVLVNNWPVYKTESSAVFRIAHHETAVLVKFYIKKDYFQSVERPINSAVNKDNCVEFFVRFGPDKSYYNIEFNCLGIGKLGYGISRKERALLSDSDVSKIGVWTKFTSMKTVFDWEIMLSIPSSVFRYQEIRSLSEQKCTANFYKCGDELPAPHYLTWSPVASAEPDFHQPEYFGDIVFCNAFA